MKGKTKKFKRDEHLENYCYFYGDKCKYINNEFFKQHAVMNQPKQKYFLPG